MRARNTKPVDSTRSAIRPRAIGRSGIKWSALVLPAFVVLFSLTSLEPSRVAHAAGPSVVQFSASSYSVQEGMTFKTITVTRTGDVGPATVDYATANISASQRTDYTAALGTLRFGANESSKSFDVLISEDIKLEGTETFTITLSNGTGQALLGSPSTASVVITDDPIETGPNPIDFTDIFVGQHYHDFLARQSDNPGQVFWEGPNLHLRHKRRLHRRPPNKCLGSLFPRDRVSADRLLRYSHSQRCVRQRQIESPLFAISARPAPDRRRGDCWEHRLGIRCWKRIARLYLQEFVSSPEFVSAFPQGVDAFTFVDTLFANEGVILSKRAASGRQRLQHRQYRWTRSSAKERRR